MRKSFQLLFTLLLVFTWCNTFAQETINSAGKIPIMKVERTHTIVSLPDNPASIAYGHSGVNNTTLSMPIPAGTPFTNLTPWTPPVFASSMIKGGNGIYYITEVGPPAALYIFNPSTGAVTFHVNITGLGSGQSPNGIAYNAANGIYYIAAGSITPAVDNIYTLDVNSGVATLVGGTGTGGLQIDLGITTTGVCYSYDLITNNAYTINLTTGVATLLGPLGFDPNYGQGMSIDNETGTVYLSAFNNGTVTGQLRTLNTSTGNTTLVTDWGFDQVAPFALDTQYGPPCPIGAPTNPNPPSGTTGVPISGNTASWTNGSGTVNVELWFGPQGSPLTKVYDGPAITSFALPTLNYSTTYLWYVVCKDATCGTQGPAWSFTTVADPNQSDFCDDFDNLSNWTVVGPFGQTNWSAFNSNYAGGTPPELYMNWSPSFTGVSTVRSVVMPNFLNNTLVNYEFKFYLDWYANPSGVVTVGMTYDGGATSIPFYTLTDPAASVGPIVVQGSFTTPATGSQNGQIEITYNGYSFNINWIAFDDLCLDWVIPVELTSFTANANFGVVELQWITATETNNQGFEVQRSAGGEFETIAFVEGHGTTTETQVYTYQDRTVRVSAYSYRLKQIDFDGTFEYSNVIDADVPAPAEFALDQNYPNPFNPSTKIAFRLAVDSKVSLKVFDILGQEVATLVNANLGVGAHSIDFDASALNSGVYLYRIEATGIDGTNFANVKKMILTK